MAAESSAGPSEVATHAYVNPVVAVLIGIYLGYEHVTTLQLAGLIVILISLLLVELPLKPKNAEMRINKLSPVKSPNVL